MAKEKILLVFGDAVLLDVISRAVLLPAGYEISTGTSPEHVIEQCKIMQPDVLIVESALPGQDSANIIRQVNQNFPAIPIILFAKEIDNEKVRAALQAGVIDILTPPVKSKIVLKTVQGALEKRDWLVEWARQEARLEEERDTQSLQRRLKELDTIGKVGRTVTASLDIGNILAAVVEAAVELTKAEECSLMLIDPETNNLFIRAAKNLGGEFVETFRLPVEDSLAGDVIVTDEPVLYNGDNPQKISTAFMVHSLIYVPLRSRSGNIGVLGVHNRVKKVPFNENHVATLAAIADYAAIALENAKLFNDAEIQRKKLDTILTKVIDGVIVVDHERRVVFMNPSARDAFGVSKRRLISRPIFDVIDHPDLLQIFRFKDNQFPCRLEIVLENGRVLNTQATLIPEVGLALTLQDITQMKELDRIKSDFVSTVSHDLRSPLTAIMGYVELLERVGPINDTQREFIQRVHFSIQNISTLINELLDLGRIEAGFDAQKEFVALDALLQLTLEEQREAADAKSITLMLEVPENLPRVYASPTRIHQVVANLVGNAIKYTQPSGWVKLSTHLEAGQLILQIIDNGPGIPVHEQPYIFDRFFRASNVNQAVGTGLGLAIVKSIVENHQGRIWVDSLPGHGSTFTLVLPLVVEQVDLPTQ